MKNIVTSLWLWYAGAKITVVSLAEMVNEKKRLRIIGFLIMLQQAILFYSVDIIFRFYTKNFITPIAFSIISSVIVYNLIRPYFANHNAADLKELNRLLYSTGSFLFLVGFVAAIPFLIQNSTGEIERGLEEPIKFWVRVRTYFNIVKSYDIFSFVKVTSFTMGLGVFFVLPVLLKNSFNWDAYNKLCLKHDSERHKENIPSASGNSPANKFSEYFRSIIESINMKMAKINDDANKEFTKGIVITLLGILLYVGFIFYWLDYFENSSGGKNEYKYFGLVSSSLLFLFIEGIGLWFLKHNRSLLNDSNNLLKHKIEIQKHYLIYFYITDNLKDFTTENEKFKFLENAINKLGSTTTIQESITEGLKKSNFADMLNILKSISDNIGKIGK